MTTAIFNRLEHHTQKFKPTKCQLFQRKVKFQGHVVSGRGAKCDPNKVAAIATWPWPTSLNILLLSILLSDLHTGLCANR